MLISKKGNNNFYLKYSLLLQIAIFCLVFHCLWAEELPIINKIAEIGEKFKIDEPNFFWKITGLCCDYQGNLYIADSGWNKIFKFSPDHKHILSFGGEGQGPGEFMANIRNMNLRISFGNDGKLYVMDQGNRRLSLFSTEGKFIMQLSIPNFINDTPVINSKGDIYLLSSSGIKVMDRYDSNFKYKNSLLDTDSHLKFPYLKPMIFGLRKPVEYEVLKLVTKKDFLILISNFSLKSYVFDWDDKKIVEFKIEEEEFVDDFKKRLKQRKSIEEQIKTKEKTAKKKTRIMSDSFICPFGAFLDKNDNLCLSYYRSNGIVTLYRYMITGDFIDTWRFPDKVSLWPIACNCKGHIYCSIERNTKIGIYAIADKRT